MRIAFDLDKVFANYPPFIPYFVIDRLSKKPTEDLKYRYPGKLEEKIRVWSHHPSLRPPITANVEALKELSQNKKNDLYLVSGRYGFLKKRTNEWFQKNKIKDIFKRTYFNFENEQPHIWKNRILRQLQIEKLVDDDLELLLYLAEKNPKVEFYWLANYPFPIPKPLLPKNVHSVKNLREFKDNYL